MDKGGDQNIFFSVDANGNAGIVECNQFRLSMYRLVRQIGATGVTDMFCW